MKEKSPSSKKPANINIKTSTANLFLNIIIILLVLLIIFLGYSFYTKLKSGIEKEEAAKREQPSRIVQVEVLNGCGISGVADEFTNYLRAKNFDVVQIGNYRSFDVEKSIVIDRIGNKSAALKLAETLGIEKSNIIKQLNKDYLLDVSFIIGRDYKKLKPYN